LRRRALIASGSASLIMPTASSWAQSARRGKPGDSAEPVSVVMAKNIDDVVTGFDPAEAYASTNIEINSNCYRKLVVQDPRDPTNIIGDLADRWQVSKDGLTYTFYIRPGSIFESAKPLTATDAAFSLQRVIKLNKAPAFILGQFGFNTNNVDQLIRATSTHVLEIKLPEERAGSFLLNCLSANIGCVVERATAMANQARNDLGNAWLRQRSAGSGPYRLAEWLPGERVVIDANPYSPVKPKVDRIELRQIEAAGSQVQELKKGAVDIARDLAPEQQQELAGKPEYTQILTQQLTSVYVAMNMAMPPLDQVEVRKAIKWAVDYQAIPRHANLAAYKVWQSFLPDGMPGSINEQPYRRDITTARKLMAQAGHREGFSVTLDHVANPTERRIAQTVQESLGAIGIQVHLQPGTRREVVDKTRGRQHQLALLTWYSDYLDPHANALAFCANPDDSDYARFRMLAWRNHYVNAEMTAWVDQAVREQDAKKRLEIYAQMQRIFMEQSPFLMLLQRGEVAALRKGITGLILGSLPDYTRYAQMTKS